MKTILFSTICLWAIAVQAQETQSISTGQGYNQQCYVNLADGTGHQKANTSWDIAFSVAPEDAGIFINESVGSAQGALAIQAYFTVSDDFNAVPEPAFFEGYPLYNREVSWSYGALNEYHEPGNPNDFGWGVYDPGTQEIQGVYVYAIQLRDGSYLKLQIQSLINGVYTFRYANFDGSGEVTKTISKSDHAGKMLAYFSFQTGTTVDIEPANGFDLIFCRYYDLLHQGGDSVQYLVTGILSADGVEVAEARQVNPDSVQYQDFIDSLSTIPDIIGQDWKFFDLNAFAWILEENLVYFVKTRDDRVWKIQFIEFQGSGSGTAVFEKTDLGIISGVHDPLSPVTEFLIYPNPASSEVNVLYQLRNVGVSNLNFQLLDASGNLIHTYSTRAGDGLNVFTMDQDDLSSGVYFIRLTNRDQSYTSSVSILK